MTARPIYASTTVNISKQVLEACTAKRIPLLTADKRILFACALSFLRNIFLYRLL